MDSDIEAAGPVAEQPRGARLDSWKEIAAYLKRDVATVRRWEKREGLSVHRHLHEKLGSVFAHTAELDAWGEGRRRMPEPGNGNGAAADVDGANGGSAESMAIEAPIAVWRRALPWGLAAICGLALTAVLLLGAPWRQPPRPTPHRVDAKLGDNLSLADSRVRFGDAAAISPDGSVTVFVAQKENQRPQLYLQRRNQLQAEPLSGTEEALAPFFAPDGSAVGFFAGGKLKRIEIAGGAPITLADAPSTRGGTWSDDGTIIFTPGQAEGSRLLQVPSAGGKAAQPLTTLVDGEVIQLWPQSLPGGKAVLFTSSSSIGSYNNADIVVQSLPRGVRQVVHKGGYHARYLPSGHLIFMHDGTLFAAPFDLTRLEMTGPPVAVLKEVNSNYLTGGAQFAVSATGTLLYLRGPTTGVGIPIEWMDREGRTAPLRKTPANWISPRFAPDRKQLAIEIRDGAPHIWLYDWTLDTIRRLTDAPTPDQNPVWTPNSQSIVFASPRADGRTANLYWQRADRPGGAQRLIESKNPQQPSAFHPSGKFLAFEEKTSSINIDVMILPILGYDDAGWKVETPIAFVKGPSAEYDPTFSPDGNWVAYTSVESGHPEVYVRPFPDRGDRWLISAGANATWSPTKHELLYGVDERIMVVPFSIQGQSFRAEKARPWSGTRYQTRGPMRMFDMHPDGERLALASAVAQPPGGAKQDSLVYIFNFFEELRLITPSPK